MITTTPGMAAAFSGGWARRALSGALLVLAAACVVPPESSLARATRQRAVGEREAERQQLERRLEVLRQTDGQYEQESATLQAESVQLDASLRALRADVARRRELVRTAEHQLAASVERALQIERELQPLRDLERQLAERQTRHAELTAALAARTAAIAALEQEGVRLEAELAPRALRLQQAVAIGKQFGSDLAAIEAALAEALAKLGAVLPAPAAPAAPPAVAPSPAPAEQPKD